MATEKVYRQLAQLVDARQRCARDNKKEWFDKHSETIRTLCKRKLPHGSGYDSGSTIDLDASTPDKLVFQTSFHHMDEDGCYDGWTEHIVTVTPSLAFGFSIKVGGRDRNDIKNYIGETFHEVLNSNA